MIFSFDLLGNFPKLYLVINYEDFPTRSELICQLTNNSIGIQDMDRQNTSITVSIFILNYGPFINLSHNTS